MSLLLMLVKAIKIHYPLIININILVEYSSSKAERHKELKRSFNV